MKKREIFGEPTYFDEYIKRATESIRLFEAKANELDTNPTHRRRLRYTIFRERLQLLIARYSGGEETTKLQKDFLNIVSALSSYQNEKGYEPFEFQNLDHYVRALWLVSLAILLKADNDIVCQLLTLIDQEGVDGLFERLATLRTSKRPKTTLLIHPEPYLPLYEALDAESNTQEQYIDKFLKRYYQEMKMTYWHDSHLRGTGSFFGYWCFELAAFVKELQIHDVSFADNIFYPRDLVGHKLFRTWEDSEEGENDRQAYKKLKASPQSG